MTNAKHDVRDASAPMAKTRYYCAMSLDGFIAESDDTLDWLLKYEGTGWEPDYERFYSGIGALVMGSVTYEWILDNLEWPYAGKPTSVLSSRELRQPGADGADVRVTAGNVRELHDEMLAAAGDRDLWIVGGGDVASQFADHGLIDQVEVTVVPDVLGSGKPLFARRLPDGPMQLLGTRAKANGMVELRYAVGSAET
jgi:dihydrofolate reductase